MPLVDMREMVQQAYAGGYAIGGFDVIDPDFLAAVIEAAERCESPIILSLAESHFQYFDFDTLMPAVEDAAKRAAVPVAIHLDHGNSMETVVKAINLGCNGVMIDASFEPFDDNVRITSDIVATAGACHIPVEGELGYVAGVEGEDAELHGGPVRYTSVEEATEFVRRTGVDMLAVSVGTVHGRMQGEPDLDFDLLARINAALGIPLVIHGGTGLSDTQFRKLIENGVTKINYYTALSDAAAARVMQNSQEPPSAGITGLRAGVRDAIAEECERCMRLWGSSGQAQSVLERVRAWQPVEHVILFKVGVDTPDDRVMSMMRHGRDVLSQIPGVREVFIGSAEAEAEYPYCWVVSFVHPDVIASYRDHPTHKQFADEHFRPMAAGRISTDYREI